MCTQAHTSYMYVFIRILVHVYTYANIGNTDKFDINRVRMLLQNFLLVRILVGNIVLSPWEVRFTYFLQLCMCI